MVRVGALAEERLRGRGKFVKRRVVWVCTARENGLRYRESGALADTGSW